MSSDISTNFDYSDNFVSFITSFDHHYYDDGFLPAVSASSSASSPLEELRLPPIQDPPPHFQELPAFPSDFAGYGDAEEGSMQRSYRSNCSFDDDSGGNGGGKFDLGREYYPPLGGGGGSDQRLVRSTGDLQRRIKSYALREVVVVRAAERYGVEERKERIQKYRAKRNLRNFNKTIKYACRKTLADSRPRIRGRFVRNDDVAGDGDGNGNTPNDGATPPANSSRHHHDNTPNGFV